MGLAMMRIRSTFRPESTRAINNQAYQQNQPKPAAANGGTAKVKPAAAEQKQKNQDDQYQIHGCSITLRGDGFYGVKPVESQGA
jgi:hypothetical protein